MNHTSEKKSFEIEGTIEKLRLVSNNIVYGPKPPEDEEIEQRLSISLSGGIWLTRYRYGDLKDKTGQTSKEKIPADEETIKRMIDAVVRDLKNYRKLTICDVGSWTLYLTNTEGRTFTINGPLIPDTLHDLSDSIRSMLGRNDLFLFDGNPDRIEKIEVLYDRHSEIETNDMVWYIHGRSVTITKK